MSQVKGKIKKFPFVIPKTKEYITSFRDYIESDYFVSLKKRYNISPLSKRCFICKNKDMYFLIPKTLNKMGREYLSDLLPICQHCCFSSSIDINNHSFLAKAIRRQGKKKIERLQFAALGFNPKRIDYNMRSFFNTISPQERGKKLAEYFSSKTKLYGVVSSVWINRQVYKTCKYMKG